MEKSNLPTKGGGVGGPNFPILIYGFLIAQA